MRSDQYIVYARSLNVILQGSLCWCHDRLAAILRYGYLMLAPSIRSLF